MNWFDTSGLTSLAKTALKEAQKTIDKALDIQDESGEEQEDDQEPENAGQPSPGSSNAASKDNADFFASWGLTVSAESSKDDSPKEQAVVTESPSKSTSQSLWGSFAGSFFEQPKSDGDSTIVRPPKAKSMNVISDSKYGSQDDLFSKSQLVMSDGEDLKVFKREQVAKVDERRVSSRSNRLSLVSSQNSSESVEVLSQSLKTTPDSEASCQSITDSSSAGQKRNSESVEILPDSLVSPSSIECLGFDSYSSDKNSTPSSNLSPDDSNKKSTPMGERTEKAETADSVSLVADDDEDTMSYNSISECTAPTVLDTDEKAAPFFKVRPELRKGVEKEIIHLEQAVFPKMQLSENSSNDGSWSDRTLNADNESVTLDNLDEQKREGDVEDALIEKLSDSSSFYNVNMGGDMLRSESSAFVNVEKQQCSTTCSSGSSQKDGSIKERTSPVSSDSKSDLVKIGSDRTSGHTSGDELETATSSDIEIIPSPNGDNGHFSRNSPAKYAFKQKLDGTTSPNLVDLVLGKSLATKIRGHNRELSEASVQSNTSDESQGSENERLLRRLSEVTEILEARECRLLEVSRSHAELAETNAELKGQVEALLARHDGGDISTITEDYTQRMSALEKKFQQAIREKDQLRKQLDTLKAECSSRKNSSELENSFREKEEMVVQLQEEGEKLAKQLLQHSNIIKKLRAKEKDNEQVIKGLRDKVCEQRAELDRVKRSMSAKEELEVSQIEAVYRLTTANNKLEAELAETRSALDDNRERLSSCQASLEGARRELGDLRRREAEGSRRLEALQRTAAHSHAAGHEAALARGELARLRADMRAEEKRWREREETLRRELAEARDLCAAQETAACSGATGGGESGGVLSPLGGEPGGVLAQLAALQAAALARERAHRAATEHMASTHAELERSLAKSIERERMSREECQGLQERVLAAEGLLQDCQQRLQLLTDQWRAAVDTAGHLEKQLELKTQELQQLKGESETRISELSARVSETERKLAEQTDALETEKKRNAILQEQVCVRGEVSPVQSLASDSLSASLWHPDEPLGTCPPLVGAVGGAGTALCVETLLAGAARREGAARARGAQLETLLHERRALHQQLATLHAQLDDHQSLQEQYDALLQMYGEKEEQLAEVRLDLHDVTQLYKAQLDELLALKKPR